MGEKWCKSMRKGTIVIDSESACHFTVMGLLVVINITFDSPRALYCPGHPDPI